MVKRRDTTDIWKYVFIGYRGKTPEGVSFADIVELKDDERLYLSLITDPPIREGRAYDEVRKAALKTGHEFSRSFYYNGMHCLEL